MRKAMKCAALIFSIGLFLTTPLVQAAEYCVKDLPGFVPSKEVLPSEKVISNEGGSIEPGWWRFDPAGNLLYAQGGGTVSNSDGKQENRFYRWNAEKIPQMSNPFSIGYSGASNDESHTATDKSGRTVYIDGSFGAGKNALYEVGPDFQPVLLNSQIQKDLAWPDSIYWSDRLKGFIVVSQDHPGYGGVTLRGNLLSGDQVYSLGAFSSGRIMDLPSFATTAVLDGSQLLFMDENNKLYSAARFDAYGEEIHDLGNDWLYIPGRAKCDSIHDELLHLVIGPDRRWQANKIIQLEQEKEGLLETAIYLILGFDKKYAKRYLLTTIIRDKGAITYSTALNKLFFLKTAEEFSDGDFIPVGKKKYEFETYVGNIERLHVALFETKDGHLYTYDGNELKPVKNGKVEPYWIGGDRLETGIIRDLPASDKVFYTIRSAAYELKHAGNEFELEKIKLPEEFASGDADLFFTRFLVTPDGGDIFILTRGSVYLLSTLAKIYSTDVPLHQINTTGSDQLPASIPQWNGVLFSTGGSYVPNDKEEHYHLLTTCEH